MYLSDEQMGAVHAGTARKVAWEPVPLPTGKQDLPAWCRGLHVDFNSGVMNAPDYRLKVLGDVYQWDDQVWAKEGTACYITRNPDGRARVLYHDGTIHEARAWRIVDDGPWPDDYPCFGVIFGMTPEASRQHQQADARRAWTRWHYVEPVRGKSIDEVARADADEHLAFVRERRIYGDTARVEIRTISATTLQHGFGGDISWLQMAGGELRALRGPWHGGAPAGYVEVATTNWAQENNVAQTARRDGKYPRLLQRDLARQWWRRSGCAGLYITEELFARIVAHYAPHVILLRVQHSYGTRLEAADPRWGGIPKAAVYDLEHRKAAANEPAGPFWRMYWDSRGSYCGSLRMPTYGYEDGVIDRTTPEEVERLKPRYW